MTTCTGTLPIKWTPGVGQPSRAHPARVPLGACACACMCAVDVCGGRDAAGGVSTCPSLSPLFNSCYLFVRGEVPSPAPSCPAPRLPSLRDFRPKSDLSSSPPAPAALEGKVASASENSTFTAGPIWELTSCSAGGEQPLSTTWDLKTTGCLLRASGCGLLQAQRPALQLLFHPLGMFQGLK